MLEDLGIAAELAANRVKYARFAYVAPQDRIIREHVDAAIQRVKEAKPVVKPGAVPVAPAHAPIKYPPVNIEGNPAKIVDAVAEAFGLSRDELIHGSKSSKFAQPRAAVALLLRTRRALSYPKIAKILRWKDHTTAVASCAKAKILLEQNGEWAARYHAVARALDQVK